jgi:spore coat protein U-like protein
VKIIFHKYFPNFVIIVCGLFFTQFGYASQTEDTTFLVQAEVVKACSISATNLDFGQYTPLSQKTGTSTINVTCTNTTGYTIALDVGTGLGAAFANRKMTSGSHLLNYNLFTDGTFTTVWGDGTGGSSTVGGTGNGAQQALTVNGRILAGEYVAPASNYQDTITVTITF